MVRVNADSVQRLREGLRTNNWDQYVQFVRREVVRQSGKSQTVEVSPEMREAARKELEPGGYWSPEAVADRIIKFAESLAQGDPQKLRQLRDAAMEGFAMAEKLLGGLPEVSLRTRELVEQRFQERLGQHRESAQTARGRPVRPSPCRACSYIASESRYQKEWSARRPVSKFSR